MNRRKSGQPLGQHFLKEQGYIEGFLDLLKLTSEDQLLEIGPGRGALTRTLLERGANLILIERDAALLPGLKRLDAELIHADAVTEPEDLSSFFSEKGITKVVGNLPFYVATAILLRYLPYLGRLSSMVFSFQKEVADRICANHGNRPYAALSVISQVFSRPHLAFTIPPGAFSPPPEVNSAVVVFSPADPPPVPYEGFSGFLRTCFRSPRKTLANNLKNANLDASGVDRHTRPADLDPDTYIQLYLSMEAS